MGRLPAVAKPVFEAARKTENPSSTRGGGPRKRPASAETGEKPTNARAKAAPALKRPAAPPLKRPAAPMKRPASRPPSPPAEEPPAAAPAVVRQIDLAATPGLADAEAALLALAKAIAPQLQPHWIAGDGNCLYRSVALQMEQGEAHHTELRVQSVAAAEGQRFHYAQFFTEQTPEAVEAWARSMRTEGHWGDGISCRTLCDFIRRPVIIWRSVLCAPGAHSHRCSNSGLLAPGRTCGWVRALHSLALAPGAASSSGRARTKETHTCGSQGATRFGCHWRLGKAWLDESRVPGPFGFGPVQPDTFGSNGSVSRNSSGSAPHVRGRKVFPQHETNKAQGGRQGEVPQAAGGHREGESRCRRNPRGHESCARSRRSLHQRRAQAVRNHRRELLARRVQQDVHGVWSPPQRPCLATRAPAQRKMGSQGSGMDAGAQLDFLSRMRPTGTENASGLALAAPPRILRATPLPSRLRLATPGAAARAGGAARLEELESLRHTSVGTLAGMGATHCARGRARNPLHQVVPAEDLLALGLVNLHLDFTTRRGGNASVTSRQKQTVIRASWKPSLPTEVLRSEAGRRAYEWLCSNNETYEFFVEKHKAVLQSQAAGEAHLWIPTAELLLGLPGLEVAARPWLYPYTGCGDTDIAQRLKALGRIAPASTPSLKTSSYRKVLSRCRDYASDFFLQLLPLRRKQEDGARDLGVRDGRLRNVLAQGRPKVGRHLPSDERAACQSSFSRWRLQNGHTRYTKELCHPPKMKS